MRRGKTGLFLSCGGTFGIPLQWRWVFRGSSWVASRVSRTLSRLKREGGISLETLQRKRASSRVEGRISWFFSSCSRKLGFLSSYDGELSDPLTLTQGSPVFWELRGASCDSSPVAARAEVLIWSWGWNHKFPLQCWHGSWRSSEVSTGKSALISCGAMKARSPLQLEKQCQTTCQVDIWISGILRDATGLSHMPSCFEWILRVTVESVQVSQVYQLWIGT